MPLAVSCNHCSKRLSIKEELAGKRVRCPVCGHTLSVPAAAPPPASSGEPPTTATSGRAVPPSRRSRTPLILVSVAALACAAGGLAFYLTREPTHEPGPDRVEAPPTPCVVDDIQMATVADHNARRIYITAIQVRAPGAGEKTLEFDAPTPALDMDILMPRGGAKRITVLKINGRAVAKSDVVLEGLKVKGSPGRTYSLYFGQNDRTLGPSQLVGVAVDGVPLYAVRVGGPNVLRGTLSTQETRETGHRSDEELFCAFRTGGGGGAGDMPAFYLRFWAESELQDLREQPSPFGLRMTDETVTDATLKELAPLKNLSALDVTRTAITDAGLKELSAHAGLSILNLSHTKVSDAGIKELAVLTNLTRLGLAGTGVTADGLKHLAPLTKLHTLSVNEPTDRALAVLRELGLLHALTWAGGDDGRRPTRPAEVAVFSLQGGGVTDAGLKELAPFTGVRKLYLAGTKVSDAGLKELAIFKNLTHLQLTGSAVTDAGVKDLVALTKLTWLNLSHTRVTDSGLKDLEALTALNTLSLARTGCTTKGIEALRQVLPNCRIER